MRTIWSIIGVILQVIGNTFKRSDVLFLGYYLAGTGKTRSLPVYVHESFVTEFFDAGINCDDFEIHMPANPMIVTTLGKFWVRVENGSFIVKDRYMFYPLCSDSDVHFSDCGCEFKEYAELYRSIYFKYEYVEKIYKSKLYKKIKNPDIKIKLGTHIMLFADVSRIGFTVNDEFWVNKGKPFDVYTEIPVTKI